MKFTTALICAAGVSHVTATGGIGLGACNSGCSVAAVPEVEAKVNPRFHPDGSVVFEKESAQCAAVCKGLVADRLAYSACLTGCAGVAE
ncbi:hypothetical protein LZL87_010453 [Fusarium oxysporum]|nr:hypothetical protein LZL87_010453 [Fusarium oxysporum]BDU14764.1 hypothetical protein g1058 [Fusarium commune]